jgi:hypothetical protein
VSAIVTIRVPRELKEAMRKFARQADWPEFLRGAILQKIRQLELEEASRTADLIRAKTRPGIYDSTETIRGDRGR